MIPGVFMSEANLILYLSKKEGLSQEDVDEIDCTSAWSKIKTDSTKLILSGICLLCYFNIITISINCLSIFLSG